MKIAIIILCIVVGLILLTTVLAIFMYFSMRSISKQFSVESCMARAQHFLGFDIGDSYEVVWNKSRAFPPQMDIVLKCTDAEKWKSIVNFCNAQKKYWRKKKLPDGNCDCRCTKHPSTYTYMAPNGDRVSYTFDFIKSESGYHEGRAEGDFECIKISYEERIIVYSRV